MSVRDCSSSRLASIRRRTWGQMFGQFIRGARKKKGLSIEEAARLAGMTVAEWEAVEAGEVPDEWARLGPIADALGMSCGQMGTFVLFCHEAWD